MVIWKYEFGLDGTLEIPEDAQVLTVQMQKGKMCCWALVNPDKPLETRHFIAYGTGREIDMGEIKTYLGTVQELNGALVWHIFEAV